MKFLAKVATLFLTGLVTSPVSPACTLTFSPISVGSSFKVRVSGYDGPVKGLRLKLTDANDRVRSAVTDSSGIARFLNAPSGNLYLSADPDNGFGQQLEVKPSGRPDLIVPIEWPSRKPIRVRSLSSTMGGLNALTGQGEEPVLSLELLEGISGRILSSINTTGRGEFDFGPQERGIYFIHLKPFSAFSGPVEGLISVAVEAAASARADRLDLHLIWTSCGLMYTDQLECPQPDVHVTKLEGHASDDSLRRAGLRAEIVLLDAARNQVAHVRTDRDGNFSFPGDLAGLFEFRIDGAGFTPVHTPIYIEPGAGSSSLEIEASGIGCSTVRVK